MIWKNNSKCKKWRRSCKCLL